MEILSGWVSLLFWLIIVFWLLAGRWEWHLPQVLAGKIGAWASAREREELRAAFTLNFEAREFASDEIEKEIYIVRKSQKGRTGSIVMNVAVQNQENIFSAEEREKAKARLERRFPGLTVNFTRKDKEEKDAFSYSDGANG